MGEAEGKVVLGVRGGVGVGAGLALTVIRLTEGKNYKDGSVGESGRQ